MPLLAIDTSAAISVAVLSDDGEVVGEAFLDDQRQHAELLAKTIEVTLAGTGLKPRDLTAIAVGTGPGPFTGLRIGLATGEAMAFALGIPIYGVCSLDAMAAEAIDVYPVQVFDEVIATLDARRKEIYWARYSLTYSGLEGFTPPQVSASEVLAAQIKIPPGPFNHCVALNDPIEYPLPNLLVVGEGALKYGLTNAQAPRFVDAAWVGQLALARAASGIKQPTTPLYIRRPDIQGQAPQAL